MFELADRLVGIYKTDNCTKTVTVDPFNIGQTPVPSLPLPPPAPVSSSHPVEAEAWILFNCIYIHFATIYVTKQH